MDVGPEKIGIFGTVVLVLLVASSGPVLGHGEQEHEAKEPVEESVAETHSRPDTYVDDASSTHPVARTEGERESRRGWFEFLFPGLAGVPDLHPMFVHFPIAFLLTALGFSLVAWLRHPRFYERLARWMLHLGLVSLPVTAASGFWAVGGWGGGHNATHRNLMLLTTLLAFVLRGLLRLVRDRRQLYRIVLTVGLLIVTVTMTLGADRGAWLVYVEGAGVQSEGYVHKKAQ